MFFLVLIVVVLLIFSCFSSPARNLPDSFADLVEKLSPAVVNITTTAIVPEREKFLKLEKFPGQYPYYVCMYTGMSG